VARQLGFRAVNGEQEKALDVVLAETNGLGVDVVFNAASGGATGEAIRFLKKVGQLVLTTELHGPITIEGSEIMKREIIINRHRARNPSSFFSAISLVANGRVDLKPIITHKMKIEDAEAGFKMMQRSEGLKILLVP
jgi:threonine dehydrogenase-like Zn-dependent dehydrogenase